MLKFVSIWGDQRLKANSLRYFGKMVSNYLENGMRKLGELETKHFVILLGIIVAFTSFMLVGITKIEFESDFSKFNPHGIPIIELNQKIEKEFSDFSSFLIVLELDNSGTNSNIQDIRDPEVINFLVRLSNNLEEEQKTQDVTSAAVFFYDGVPNTLEDVKDKLSEFEGSGRFFNNGKSVTVILLSSDVGQDSVKISELTNRVREIIDDSGVPTGVKATLTGEPALGSKIFEFIIRDGMVTLLITTIAIYILLLFITRSFKDSLVIIVPVLLGVSWTMGALGWLGIPVTVATAALGSMILGLGTEYSIFLHSRYKEERARHDYPIAIREALGTTGVSTISSGLTTVMGFFALTFSLFPLLSDLGTSLGLGIVFVLASTMLGGPLVMVIEEKTTKHHHKKEERKKADKKTMNAFEHYGEFLSKNPWLVIIVMIIVTYIVYMGASRIDQKEIDFFNVLPQDLEELKAFRVIQNEFSDTTGLKIYVYLDKNLPNSDEPIDIRDPKVIRYVDVLTQKSEHVLYSINVDSISKIEKQVNNDIIPSTLSEQKELISTLNWREYINEDYSAMIIFLEFDDDAATNNQAEISRQLYEIVETTSSPAGVTARPAGAMIEEYELNKLNGPDSSRTGMIAFAGIIVFLVILTRSFRNTVLPLLTVVLAIVWIFGMLGYFGVPFNSITSSVISMSIGVGIDFGIQLSLRFKHELKDKSIGKRKAMARTLQYTMYPMVITVIAALIGFQAMRFGELTLMGDLGMAMSFAIVSSMIVAVTIVSGLLVVSQREHKNLNTEKRRNK